MQQKHPRIRAIIWGQREYKIVIEPKYKNVSDGELIYYIDKEASFYI